MTTAFLAVLVLFSVGGGVMTASSFPLEPLFLESSSGWMLGKTPPAATVTPFSSCTHTSKNTTQGSTLRTLFHWPVRKVVKMVLTLPVPIIK